MEGDYQTNFSGQRYSTCIQLVIFYFYEVAPILILTIDENGFALDIESIKKVITSKTKVILYCF